MCIAYRCAWNYAHSHVKKISCCSELVCKEESCASAEKSGAKIGIGVVLQIQMVQPMSEKSRLKMTQGSHTLVGGQRKKSEE